MTVCIAAIADTGMIIGATDLMLTAGDVEFEPIRQAAPRLGKIFPLTNSIVALTAGDTAVQAEIMHQYLRPNINKWLSEHPDVWLPVEEVVRLYRHGYNLIRRTKAEQAILLPLGITYDTFITHQKDMTPDFVNRVARSLAEFVLEPTETIITGVEPSWIPDATMSRIYVIHGHNAMCHDTVRFAAIGSGSRHADSHFMQVRHAPSASIPQTLLSVYTAKKKAEIAPGVGSETNMFIIGPSLGTFNWLRDDIMSKLEATYQSTVHEHKEAELKANADIESYITKIATDPAPQTSRPNE